MKPNLNIELSEEELQIFLAETDEQLQILEEGLIRLEQQENDPDLLQVLFRAAHTLKGSAGMIDHHAMVEVTHRLETILDGVRKARLPVSEPLVDACLKAVDVLHLLRNEIAGGEPVAVVEPVLALLDQVNELAINNPGASTVSGPEAAPDAAVGPGALSLQADICAESIAPSARALQILLALQECGQIAWMDPTQEQIEQAAPVARFRAVINTSLAPAEIQSRLQAISEIENVQVAPYQAASGTVEGQTIDLDGDEPESVPLRLGDYLVENGLITAKQLEHALKLQQQEDQQSGKGRVLGKILVDQGLISAELLDQATTRQMQQMKTALLEARQQGTPAGSRQHDKTVRTSIERLDRLMNLVGELITDRNRLYQIRSDMENGSDSSAEFALLTETITHVGRITDQLQEEVMGIRMLPIASVFNKFPRLVRDLAHRLDKNINLVMRGEDTELDRSVIEKIGDPLIHLIRNAVDHGIEAPQQRRQAGKPETGTVLLTARHESGQIVITIRDDGQGLDAEKLRASALRKGLLSESEAAALSEDECIDLIFRSGFSTAQQISEVSGRGVGMDIVRTNIESLNGTIMVDSWPGEGTQFQIVLPLTLAILSTLLVKVNHNKLAVPLVSVTETLRVQCSEIKTIQGRPAITLRDSVLPVVYLSKVLGFSNGAESRQHVYIVALRSGKSQLGLAVDHFVGEEEVMLKSLGLLSGKIAGISGAAILGDGLVSLVLDIPGIFKLASSQSWREQTGGVYSEKPGQPAGQPAQAAAAQVADTTPRKRRKNGTNKPPNNA